MTTYATYVANLGDLSITGVNRAYDEPPKALNTADLPASWVQLPEGEEGPLTFQTHGGWPILRADLVVALEAVGQERQAQNFSDTVTMMDSMSTALRGVTVGSTLGKGPINWTMRQAIIPVADVDYWAVVASVEGYG